MIFTMVQYFVVWSLLVLGPKYQVLPSWRFWATKTVENRNDLMRNGWGTARWSCHTNHRRWSTVGGVGWGARVMLELANVVNSCGPFGASSESFSHSKKCLYHIFMSVYVLSGWVWRHNWNWCFHQCSVDTSTNWTRLHLHQIFLRL